MSKVAILFALFAFTNAQYEGYGHGHGHGHAISTQSFVKHEAPVVHHKKLIVPLHHEPVHAPIHKGHAVSSQSFVSHHAPVHHAPVYHAPVHHAPVHHEPILHHAPVVHHVPIVHHAPILHHAPIHHAPIHHHEEEYHHHPAYKFEYSVHDEHTKDIKSQQESRDGDKVEGHYSLLQPDGHIRNVAYHADKHSGFNAEVTYSHPGHHHGYH